MLVSGFLRIICIIVVNIGNRIIDVYLLIGRKLKKYMVELCLFIVLGLERYNGGIRAWVYDSVDT